MLRADFNRISSHIYFQDNNNSSFCKQNSAWRRIFTEKNRKMGNPSAMEMTSIKNRQTIKPFALITGGSSGIGLAVARELGLRGYSLVLVGRSEERLSQAREILMQDLNEELDILCLSVDLSREDAAQELFDWTQQKGLFVEVLVNNAGMYFFKEAIAMEASQTEALIRLNVLSLTRLCQLFGAEKAERAFASEQVAPDGHRLASGQEKPAAECENPDDKKAAGKPGRTYILNISSYSVYMPWAGWSLYSASKAYVKNFSIALSRELRGSGVVVTCAAPAGVATCLLGLPSKLSRLGRSCGILMRPETCARRIVRALFRQREYIIPGWYYRPLIPIVRLIGWCFPQQLHRLLKKLFSH